MELIPKRAKSKLPNDAWNIGEERRTLSIERSKEFKAWLTAYKKYQIHEVNHKPRYPFKKVIFWYQETPNSPKITLELDCKKKRRLHVLGCDHLNEFEAYLCKMTKR